MATFMMRAFNLAPATADHYGDDNGSVHEPAINAMDESGITNGYTDASYCASDQVTRGHLATFLLRALEMDPSATTAFPDSPITGHDGAINALASAGIVEGCSSTDFCPWSSVPRSLMAANLGRVLGLDEIVPPPPLFPAHPQVGDGKRIIYANAAQRVWLIDDHNVVVDSYLVSGRAGAFAVGNYSVFSKPENAFSYSGITMD